MRCTAGAFENQTWLQCEHESGHKGRYEATGAASVYVWPDANGGAEVFPVKRKNANIPAPPVHIHVVSNEQCTFVHPVLDSRGKIVRKIGCPFSGYHIHWRGKTYTSFEKIPESQRAAFDRACAKQAQRKEREKLRPVTMHSAQPGAQVSVSSTGEVYVLNGAGSWDRVPNDRIIGIEFGNVEQGEADSEHYRNWMRDR